MPFEKHFMLYVAVESTHALTLDDLKRTVFILLISAIVNSFRDMKHLYFCVCLILFVLFVCLFVCLFKDTVQMRKFGS